ncbi:MAG: hypothetical protein E4G99_12370 [Anaerolineales bacterium]|nr:MAG: hypothetical protein E4G99_12370 [Anaerolineales bacterium]
MRFHTNLVIFVLLILGIGIVTTLGPPERSLGANVRLVYLHGAWVWTALISYAIAAMIGITGLVLKRLRWNQWSLTMGRVATFFWLSYIPLSIWTMQANWNGLYLAEPRFKVAIDFSIAGILIQIALVLLRDVRWGSALNTLFFAGLWLTLRSTQQIMHPPSPILTSDSILIRLFFFLLVGLCLLAAWQVSLWLHHRTFAEQ